jgi:hypothetical protein
MTSPQSSFERQFPHAGFFGNLTKTGDNTWLDGSTGDVFTLNPDSSWDRKFAPRIAIKVKGGLFVHIDTLNQITHDTDLLAIAHCEFTEPFTFPPNLSILVLEYCKGCHFLGRLPDTIREIKITRSDLKVTSHLFSPSQVTLESVLLDHNSLQKVPENLPHNVMMLDLANNCITELPDACCFHKGMARVCLDNNAMTDLPQWIVRDTGPDTDILLRGNRFWFNAYSNINLNKVVEDWHLVMADRFFGYSGLYNNFLRVRNVQRTTTQTQQVLDYSQLRHQGLHEPYDPNAVPDGDDGGGLAAFHHDPQYTREVRPALHHEPPRRRIGRTTAEDGQNVHLPSVQHSFGDSVKRIMDHSAKDHPEFISEMRDYYGSKGFFSCFAITPVTVKHVQKMCRCEVCCSQKRPLAARDRGSLQTSGGNKVLAFPQVPDDLQ